MERLVRVATRARPARVVNGRLNGPEPGEARPEPRLVPRCEPPDLYEPITELLRAICEERQRPLFVLASEYIDEDVYDEVYRWKRYLRDAGKGNNLDVLLHSPGGSLSEC